MYKKLGQNSKVWKNEIRIPMFIKEPKFQYLKGSDQNSNVWKDKIIIPMLIQMGPEFHGFEG